MLVTYSTGARFAGGGIGNTSYHAVRGLHRHCILEGLICGSYRPTDIPASRIRAMGSASRVLRKLAVYDEWNWLDHGYRVLYDHWAAREVPICDVFQGWSGYCLQSLRRAASLGAVTVLDRALAHPTYLNRLLQEEYLNWGLSHRWSPSAERITREVATADHVILPSAFVVDTFLAEGEEEQKLTELPFGVDTHRFCPSEERRKDDSFRALFVGHVSVRKGVPYLLEAWRRLNWKDAELWIAGQNKLSAELRTKYGDLTGVQFLGHVSNPVQVFQSADVFVFPSLAEGSALVTYEALACGLPVLTTRNAGSVVRDGIEGFIVPIRDVEALANYLERLRADERLRKEMSEAARVRAKAYTWDRYGDALVEALRTLVGMSSDAQMQESVEP